jgi:hypothetical protein
MKEAEQRILFLTAALFNWAVAAALAVDAGFLFRLFSVSPEPAEPLFVLLFAWLVFAFGVAYYWISRDPGANTPLIRLGILGKAGVFAVALACVILGIVSWQFLILAAVDAVYALLFWRSLRD